MDEKLFIVSTLQGMKWVEVGRYKKFTDALEAKSRERSLGQSVKLHTLFNIEAGAVIDYSRGWWENAPRTPS